MSNTSWSIGTRRGLILLVLGLGLSSSRPLRAQEQTIRPLRLQGLELNGLHSTLTENWITLELTVGNPNSEGRDARVVVFYANQPEIQYARDVWVPPQSSLMTWMLLGPAPPQPGRQESGIGDPASSGRAREL